jgi:hypothetical protein
MTSKETNKYLESKAKTSGDIWSDMETVNDAFRRGTLDGDEKWVPLEDAQRIISNLEKELEEAVRIANDRGKGW